MPAPRPSGFLACRTRWILTRRALTQEEPSHASPHFSPCSVVLVAAATFLLSCGSSSSTHAKMATVQVSLSDPATCSAPQGSFSHVYVTVSDVRIHQSASASDTDSGWVDLAPAWPAVRCR